MMAQVTFSVSIGYHNSNKKHTKTRTKKTTNTLLSVNNFSRK